MVSAQDITERWHRKLLQNNRHVRYMWIPYTDSVVVVTNRRVEEVTTAHHGFFWGRCMKKENLVVVDVLATTVMVFIA